MQSNIEESISDNQMSRRHAAIDTIATSQSGTSFHKFALMPLEMRDMVWYWTIVSDAPQHYHSAPNTPFSRTALKPNIAQTVIEASSQQFNPPEATEATEAHSTPNATEATESQVTPASTWVRADDFGSPAWITVSQVNKEARNCAHRHLPNEFVLRSASAAQRLSWTLQHLSVQSDMGDTRRDIGRKTLISFMDGLDAADILENLAQHIRSCRQSQLGELSIVINRTLLPVAVAGVSPSECPRKRFEQAIITMTASNHALIDDETDPERFQLQFSAIASAAQAKRQDPESAWKDAFERSLREQGCAQVKNVSTETESPFGELSAGWKQLEFSVPAHAWEREGGVSEEVPKTHWLCRRREKIY